MGTASSPRRSSSDQETPRRQPGSRGRPTRRLAFGLLAPIASLPLLLYLLAPIIGLVVRTTPAALNCCWEAINALRLSLFTATVATAVSVVIGTPAAYWLSHHDFRGKDAVDTLIDLPLVLPPVAGGLALLLLYGRQGLGAFLAQHEIRLSFTVTAVIMAQVFIASPFYVKHARAGFEAVPATLRLASATLGASRLRTFLRVTAPLARHALVAGAVMTWARALGEFGATIVFAGAFPGRTETMPVAIYSSSSAATPEGLRTSIALAVVLVAVSFLVIALAKRLMRHSLSASDVP
jgi:molybdate transport system permease protein